MVDNCMPAAFNIQYLVCIQPDHLALLYQMYIELGFSMYFFNRIMQHLGEGKVLNGLQYIV